MAQCPILRTDQGDLYITLHSIKHHLNLLGKYSAALQLIDEGYSFKNINYRL